MLHDYATFFAATTGASSGFTGLLFVALTLSNQFDRDSRSSARREALAGASFTQLLDAFFVSVVSLTGDVHALAAGSIAMAAIGLWATSQLLPRVIRTGNWSRTAAHRKRNIALPVASVAAYALQLVSASALLFAPNSSVLVRLTALVLLALFAGALLRSWEVIQPEGPSH
jgi:hypothetical protein